MRVNGCELASGTGFVVVHGEMPYLITNWHNVTGRDPATNALLSNTGGIPDELVILHNVKGQLGKWTFKSETLYVNDHPRWLGHSTHGQKVDVVALPLENLDDVDLYPYPIDPPEGEFLVGPGEVVSVIGFPFGLTGGGGLGIWATGFVATELEVEYEDLPQFLVDCRARRGQSGSAVIAHRASGALCRMPDSRSAILTGNVSQLLGIYSGRINEQSDLGKVWKRRAILEVLSGS